MVLVMMMGMWLNQLIHQVDHKNSVKYLKSENQSLKMEIRLVWVFK
jgi:hypothetical protein